MNERSIVDAGAQSRESGIVSNTNKFLLAREQKKFTVRVAARLGSPHKQGPTRLPATAIHAINGQARVYKRPEELRLDGQFSKTTAERREIGRWTVLSLKMYAMLAY